MSLLSQLREITVVVADTGDIEAIKRHQPQDATTNPSLIYKAAQLEQYRDLVEEAVQFAKGRASNPREVVELWLDKVAVNFGRSILEIVPGRVSTEVDARLSFDTPGTIAKAKHLIDLYESVGVDRKRVLIKVASTWEGIRAAEQLEKEDIHCNLTLLFSPVQAIACAEADVTLISPFVGRIYDWYKQARGVDHIEPAEDPGVASVTQIYNYFKKFDYTTEVMGASFRNAGEIIELAGCDLLTIAPELLEELDGREGTLERKLEATKARTEEIDRIDLDEEKFRWHLNEDAMATEKLAEGIRRFAADLKKLIEYGAEFGLSSEAVLASR